MLPRPPSQILCLFSCDNAKRIHRICWGQRRGKLIPELEDERDNYQETD
jgi:hypothetical protein